MNFSVFNFFNWVKNGYVNFMWHFDLNLKAYSLILKFIFESESFLILKKKLSLKSQ
jgi:hypothetical protein